MTKNKHHKLKNNYNNINASDCKNFTSLLTESDTIINSVKYHLDELVDNYTRLGELARNSRLVGEAGHPPDGDNSRDDYDISFNHTSHKITNIKQIGNTFQGDFVLLDTPIGFTLQSMIKENIQLSTSLRGYCDEMPNEYGDYVSGLTIITQDIVMTPAYEKAILAKTQDIIIQNEEMANKNNKVLHNSYNFKQNYKKNDLTRELLIFFSLVNN